VTSILLPALIGCAGVPAPSEIRLAGIVVDDVRLAHPDESGLASVVRNNVMQNARAGMTLLPEDQIYAGPRVHLAIHYPSGSELLMRPRSSGRIGSFRTAIGEFFVRVRGKFSIETEFVRAAASGTAWSMRTGAGGETTVLVIQGRVLCESPQGQWRSVELEEGQMITARQLEPVPTTAPASEFRRTQKWVEQVEHLVPPPQSGVAREVAPLAIGALIAFILSRSGERPSKPNQNQAPNR
jgi:hypothetical protein